MAPPARRSDAGAVRDRRRLRHLQGEPRGCGSERAASRPAARGAGRGRRPAAEHEGRAKGSALGLRWELRGNTAGVRVKGGTEGPRIPCGPSRGEQGRGWEQRGRVVSEAPGKGLPEEAEGARRAEGEHLALASFPLPARIWYEVVLSWPCPFRPVLGAAEFGRADPFLFPQKPAGA